MSIPNCSNGAEATATRGCVLPRASLVLTITTAQKIFAISSSRDKISCHNFARLSAWCWRALHASGIFQIFHLSFRATARESSQQAYFAPLDCHVTTFVAPRNDKRKNAIPSSVGVPPILSFCQCQVRQLACKGTQILT